MTSTDTSTSTGQPLSAVAAARIAEDAAWAAFDDADAALEDAMHYGRCLERTGASAAKRTAAMVASHDATQRYADAGAVAWAATKYTDDLIESASGQ